MEIGIPKEIKTLEHRVAMTPAAVNVFSEKGHQVFVETDAGTGAGFNDDEYASAGATILDSAEAVFAASKLLIKVKEPQPQECKMLNKHHILFTFLHLAPDPEQARLLLDSGASCIAYETVSDKSGQLPLLAPMSEIAGRLSVQAGAACLEKVRQGRGVLLGGAAGVAPARVLVIGGGNVGSNAVRIALGMGANVTVLDRSLDQLRRLNNIFPRGLSTQYATGEALDTQLAVSDLVIGAVLVPGASSPKLVSRAHLENMKPGAVLVDVAIDQGGCFESSRATTHAEPSFVEQGIVHYCVANMPGAVPRTSTMALTHATLPFALAIADKGLKALEDNPYLCEGLNIAKGYVTHAAVADALGENYVSALDVIRS